MKNIGGSLLLSSSPEILKPIQFKNGILIIIPDYTKDTHRLEFHSGDLKIFLASHPNGFSCSVLAKRIVEQISDKIIEQAKYIVRCGGLCVFS